MTGLIVVLVVVIAAREMVCVLERRAWAAEREALVGQITGERRDFIALVDRLCQRVQAPAEAVVEHQIANAPVHAPSAPAFDDDEAYWRANESTEELAERLMREELEKRRAEVQ